MKPVVTRRKVEASATKISDKQARKLRLAKKEWDKFNSSVTERKNAYLQEQVKHIREDKSHGDIVFTSNLQTRLVGDLRVVKLSEREKIVRQEGLEKHLKKEHLRKLKAANAWKPSKETEKSPNLKYEVKAKNKRKKAGWLPAMAASQGQADILNKTGEVRKNVPLEENKVSVVYKTGRKTAVYSPNLSYDKHSAKLKLTTKF